MLLICSLHLFFPIFQQYSEVGIYKRKQESKKTRKQELDQESDQENKKKKKENTL